MRTARHRGAKYAKLKHMDMTMSRTIVVDGPFDWQLMLRYAARRSQDLIDMVVGDQYHRLIVHGGAPFLIRASAGEPDGQTLDLSLVGLELPPDAAALDAAEAALRRVFALDQSPAAFYETLGGDPVLGPLIIGLWGMRPLGGPSIFEMLITAILGQQISMIAAHAIKQRLVLSLGASATADGRLYHAFPTPSALAAVSEDDLLVLKFSRRKAEYARQLAIDIAHGALDLDALRGQPHEVILEQLLRIRGIGHWTAEYVLLRGYGYPDALPAGDAGLRRQVFKYYDLPAPPTEAEITAIGETWRPYRSWATLYLWSAEWAVDRSSSP
jgi:DNA-3-methyladenine glycosylase II